MLRGTPRPVPRPPDGRSGLRNSQQTITTSEKQSRLGTEPRTPPQMPHGVHKATPRSAALRGQEPGPGPLPPITVGPGAAPTSHQRSLHRSQSQTPPAALRASNNTPFTPRVTQEREGLAAHASHPVAGLPGVRFLTSGEMGERHHRGLHSTRVGIKWVCLQSTPKERTPCACHDPNCR